MNCKALDGWNTFRKSGDSEDLKGFLSEDIVFESPVLHTPQVGRDAALKYFQAAHAVLSPTPFEYVGEWWSDTGVVLEFNTVIGEIAIDGIDIISFDASGETITAFKVFLRPLKAIQAVGQGMAAQLAPA